MRNLTIGVLVIVAIFLSGCQQQSQELSDYFKELEDSQVRLREQADKLLEKSESFRVSQERGRRPNLAPVQEALDAVITGLKQEKKRLSELSVPEPAETLHQLVLERLDTQLVVYGKISERNALHSRQGKLVDELDPDFSDGERSLSESNALDAKVEEINRDLEELTSQARALEQQAVEEWRRLGKRYEIEVEAEFEESAKDLRRDL